MDEDVKTLLAVLALFYGSSSGLGLFRTALDPVTSRTDTLKEAMAAKGVSPEYLKHNRWSLFRALWFPSAIGFVVLVLVLPLFLALVVWLGPEQALAFVGLAAGPSSTHGPSPFYWILLALSLASTAHLLSPYFKGWWNFAKSLG
jgi:hypothetical protein